MNETHTSQLFPTYNDENRRRVKEEEEREEAEEEEEEQEGEGEQVEEENGLEDRAGERTGGSGVLALVVVVERGNLIGREVLTVRFDEHCAG